MTINGEDLALLRIDLKCDCCGKTFSVSKAYVDFMGGLEFVPQRCGECFDKEMRRRQEENQKKIKEQLTELYMLDLNLTPDIKNASFGNFQPQSERQTKAFEYAKEFVTNDDYIVILYGRTGTGKSHLAVSMLREWCSKDEPRCGYTTEKEIFYDCTKTISSKSTTIDSVLDKYINYDQLVIDELGRAEPSPFKKENLLEIITQRLERKKKTVIIGNMTTETLVAYFSDAVLSRMKAGGHSFLFTEEDYRSKK